MQQKMWTWHTWNHLIAIVGLYFIFSTASWGLLVAALCLGLITDLIANISLHRYLSHKSFKTGKLRDIFLRYSSIYTGLGSPIMWVIAHRQHHADSDTSDDYQNPRIIGKFRSWFTIYPKTSFRSAYGKDVIRCKHNRFIHKYYFKIQAALYISLFLINPWLPVVVMAIPMIMTFHGAAAIGVLTHTWGYRVIDSKDKSTNNWVASILSCGEGWHNYHHSRPGDYRHGHQWWEIDPPAWIIEKVFIVHD